MCERESLIDILEPIPHSSIRKNSMNLFEAHGLLMQGQFFSGFTGYYLIDF